MMTGIIFRNAVTVTVDMEGSEDDRVPIVGLLDNSSTNELDLPAPLQPFRKETVGDRWHFALYSSSRVLST
jgi:hypothetical protein